MLFKMHTLESVTCGNVDLNIGYRLSPRGRSFLDGQ